MKAEVIILRDYQVSRPEPVKLALVSAVPCPKCAVNFNDVKSCEFQICPKNNEDED